MIGIVYSSKTGNTQSLANSLNFMESKYCVSVEDAKDLEPVDLLCIGFWCDKGDCDDSMKQYLSTLRNQNVFLFGTAGFGGSQEYFQKVLGQIKENIDSSNTIIGEYMCQGKMPQSVRERYVKMKEQPNHMPNLDMMIKNFDRALSHPDKNDLDKLSKMVVE